MKETARSGHQDIRPGGDHPGYILKADVTVHLYGYVYLAKGIGNCLLTGETGVYGRSIIDRSCSKIANPNGIFGTKCPSIRSKRRRSTPILSRRRTSSSK